MGYFNPLLKLPAGQALLNLPASDRRRIELVMRDLRAQANVEAERSWRLRKGPMAAYYRAVSTYARHLAHALSFKAETTGQDFPESALSQLRAMCDQAGVPLDEGNLAQSIKALADIQDDMRSKIGLARQTLDAIGNSLDDSELRDVAKQTYQKL
jgi:hypothetical protein